MTQHPDLSSTTTVWKPLSLTYVTYPITGGVGDVISPLLALLSLTPPFLVCALVASTFVYWDVVAAYLLIGVLGSVGVTSLLKKVIQQPRPLRHDYIILEEMDYGMPSNHSCFVFFIATFITLYCIREVGAKWTVNTLPSRQQQHSNNTRHHRIRRHEQHRIVQIWHQLHTTTFIIATSITTAIGCAYSRIHLLYHTPSQVLVGAGLGIVLGSAWYFIFETQGTGVQRILEQIDTLLNNLDQREG